MSETRPPPLSGLTVIDMGQIYQGPYAGLLLAKAGAMVIKVEPPHGEPLRAREAVGGGASLPLAMLNSNKRAITLNLKTARGVKLLQALARKADVLLENFAPGVMDRLGAGAERLMADNPRLIYASATGYGLSGPERDNLAMDITIQAARAPSASPVFPTARRSRPARRSPISSRERTSTAPSSPPSTSASGPAAEGWSRWR